MEEKNASASRVAEAMNAQKTQQQLKTRGLTVQEKVNSAGTLAGLNQKEVSTYLMGMKDRVAQVLPKHLTAERVISMAATTIAKNPKIADCSPASLLGSVMQASILGFPPVEALGYCYFVPYKKQIQFQIGYKGLIELARRSGKIKMVYAEVVREGDVFNVEMGLSPKLEHKPVFDSSKPMTYVYAVCHFSDGGYNFVVLSRSDVERLRMRSPMQDAAPSGAWLTDYDAMAKAKALKQLAKYMPLNIDQQEAVATDESVLTPENFMNGDGKVRIEDVEYDTTDIPYEDVNVETGETAPAENREQK